MNITLLPDKYARKLSHYCDSQFTSLWLYTSVDNYLKMEKRNLRQKQSYERLAKKRLLQEQLTNT